MLDADLYRLEQLGHGEVILLADVAQLLGQVGFQPIQQGRQLLLLCCLAAVHILLLLLDHPEAQALMSHPCEPYISTQLLFLPAPSEGGDAQTTCITIHTYVCTDVHNKFILADRQTARQAGTQTETQSTNNLSTCR